MYIRQRESESSLVEFVKRIQVDNASIYKQMLLKITIWNQDFVIVWIIWNKNQHRSMPSTIHGVKGKVESPFSYLETHLFQGNEFTSFEDFKI